MILLTLRYLKTNIILPEYSNFLNYLGNVIIHILNNYRYKCNNDYKIKGGSGPDDMERVVKCQPDGTWADTPVCVSECKFHNCTKFVMDLGT